MILLAHPFVFWLLVGVGLVGFACGIGAITYSDDGDFWAGFIVAFIVYFVVVALVGFILLMLWAINSPSPKG